MRYMVLLISLLFVMGLSACGDTWRGAKQDTQDNVDATKRAL